MSHVVRHLVIRGRVQRVGYRAFVEHMALKLDIEGWVRNRADGSVETLVAGLAAAVEGMIEACRRGPPSARVETLEEREGGSADIALRRRGEKFSVLPTV
jgi:acylphosphatase